MQAPRFERAFKWKHWIFFVLFSQTPTCLREPASTGSQIHVKVSHTVISKFGAINDCSNEIVYPYFRKCLKIFLTKFPPSYSSNLHLVWFKVCFKFLDRNQSKWGILTYIYIYQYIIGSCKKLGSNQPNMEAALWVLLLVVRHPSSFISHILGSMALGKSKEAWVFPPEMKKHNIYIRYIYKH